MIQITKPTLVVNSDRVCRNIGKLQSRTISAGIRLRPHFKTHQSKEVGQICRESGISSITVSSIDMAKFFAENGWDDITIAFPLNIRQIDDVVELATRVRLGVVIESPEHVAALASTLRSFVHVWLKIDTGYHRTGLAWNNPENIASLAKACAANERTMLTGLLTHAGNTYQANTPDDICSRYFESVERIGTVKDYLSMEMGNNDLEISVGDTPGCSLVPDFGSVDEIRPGNFIFYDLMQVKLGSCSTSEVAAAVACPVVAHHPERSTLIVHGGAVHHSKEHLDWRDGLRIYGGVAQTKGELWGEIRQDAWLVGLSQEHGIIRYHEDPPARIGELLYIVPVHSCLTANLMRDQVAIVSES